MIVLLFVLLLTQTVTAVLLFRATKRLLDFDFIWNSIVEELITYEEDLEKMSSGDILIDNPDVMAFHKRNRKALRAVSAAVKSVVETRAPRPAKPVLPRPEVE